MNGLRGTGLVAGREIREATRRKTFWIVAGILLLGSIAGMVVPDLIDDDGPTRYEVGLADAPEGFDATLEQLVATVDAELRLVPYDDADAARGAVEDDDVDVAVIGSDPPVLVARESSNDQLVGLVRQALATQGLVDQLHEAGLTDAQVQEALSAPPAEVQRVGHDESSRRGAAVVVSLVMYLLLLILMIMVANGVAIEKANRISEVLLAIVRPPALLFGKVLGVGLIGLFTLLCGLLPVVVKLGVGGDLPAGLGAAAAGAAAWFVIGTALYLTIAGALGALVERQEEAGSVVSPLTMILVVSYLVGQSAADSPLGTVMSYLPLTSPMVTPARIAMGVTTPTELVVSLALGLVAVFIAVRFGAVVYRRAIERTGRRLKLRDVLRPA